MKRKPIDKQTLKKHELLRCDCTIHDIKDGNEELGLIGTGLGLSTISNYFTTKKATKDVATKMKEFFNQKYFNEMEVPA